MSKGKIIIITLALVAATSMIHAQGITGGLKAGMNIANIHGDDVEDFGYESKTGLCVGGFVAFNVANIVAIQPEVLYTQKGAKYEDEFFDGTYTLGLDYLEIPVLLKVIMPVQGMIKPHLFVGPYFARNLTARTTWEENGQSYEENVTEYVEDSDFGTVFGAGIDFGLPAGKIVFDARYSLGLTSIDASGDPADIKNKAFSFMLGYAF